MAKTQTTENLTPADRAADKLREQAERVKKINGGGFTQVALRTLAEPICAMLIKFCYQDEIFAEAVNKKDKTFLDCLNAILKLETKAKPMVSDLDAYAEAVRFYFPDGKVTMSCRVVIPVERDDDLFDLGVEDEEPQGGAIILELPLLD